MIKFNRRSWLLSIRISQLDDIDPMLRPAALALQAAVVAEGLADDGASAYPFEAAAERRKSARRSARRRRPAPRRSFTASRAGF